MPAERISLASPADVEQEIKRIKKELKEWEHTFAEREGRKPSKQDIAQDKDIARQYKAYAKLKATLEGREAGKPAKLGSPEKAVSNGPKTQKEEGVAQAAEDGIDAPVESRPQSRSTKKREAAPRSPTSDTVPESIAVMPRPSSTIPSKNRPARKQNFAPPQPDGNNAPSDDVRKGRVTSPPSANRRMSTGTSQKGDASEPNPAQSTSPRSSGVKANFIGKEAVYAAATRREMEEDIEASNSVRRQSNSVEPEQVQQQHRPWGTGYDLPENFRLRRTTIATGPMATTGIVGSPMGFGLSQSRPSTAGAGVSPAVYSPLYTSSNSPSSVETRGGLTDDVGSSEYQEFMNRKKQLENVTTTVNAFARSTASTPPTQPSPSQRPMSPVQQRPTPIVTQIVVNSVQQPQHPIETTTTSPTSAASPFAITKEELRELAKPYDPTAADHAPPVLAKQVVVRNQGLPNRPTTTQAFAAAAPPPSAAPVSLPPPASPTSPTLGETKNEADEDNEDSKNGVMPVASHTPTTGSAMEGGLGLGVKASAINQPKLF
ncbi:hypothetical protein HK102_012104, partial [Quaeritorhiza haematococci]